MNTVAIGLDEKTASDLAQLARPRAVEPSALAGEAIRSYLRTEASAPWTGKPKPSAGCTPICSLPFRTNTWRFMVGNWSTTTLINRFCSSALNHVSRASRC